MESTVQSRLSSERGAVLIHVAVALLGLIAFTRSLSITA